jgi:hypothetical protein
LYIGRTYHYERPVPYQSFVMIAVSSEILPVGVLLLRINATGRAVGQGW